VSVLRQIGERPVNPFVADVLAQLERIDDPAERFHAAGALGSREGRQAVYEVRMRALMILHERVGPPDRTRVSRLAAQLGLHVERVRSNLAKARQLEAREGRP
jgi:hypothetical protein